MNGRFSARSSVTSVSLARIAGESGFSMSDVAFLAGLEESTICRLWEAPEWIDRISGKSLQALISVLPGVAEYVFGFPLAARRNLLAEELGKVGLEVNRASYRRLVQEDGVPEQYLGNTLSTAIQIVNADTRTAAAYLVRFWGREQDYVLGFLFSVTSSKALLVNVEPLMSATYRMIDELARYKNSFHAIVAQANLMHHVVKATGDWPTELTSSTVERHTALTYRSATMGLLIRSDDREVASAYRRAVDRSVLLSMVEKWAFPTYTHDTRPAADFSLPPSLLLRRTADEILWEVDHYNDAYLCYLLEMGIPKVIEHDKTFGLRVADLVASLHRRREVCEDAATAKACEEFLDKLDADSADKAGDTLDRPW